MADNDSLQALLALQRPDGGWPYRPGKTSRAEPTALAMLALDPAAPESAAGRRWIEAQQRSDGAWSASEGVGESAWPTPLCLLALGAHSPDRSSTALERGGAFLIEAQPAVIEETGEIEVAGELRGWSWTRDTFSWVLPTSYALLALKKYWRGDEALRKARIEEAEAMLWNRMCEDGGWNFGNAAAFGVPMRPFPLPTALALLALQDHPDDRRFSESLALLPRVVSEEPSILGLAWCLIVMRVQEEGAVEIRTELARRLKIESSGWSALDVPSLAVAAIALAPRTRLDAFTL